MSGSIAVSAFNECTRPELISLLEMQDADAGRWADASICDND